MFSGLSGTRLSGFPTLYWNQVFRFSSTRFSVSHYSRFSGFPSTLLPCTLPEPVFQVSQHLTVTRFWVSQHPITGTRCRVSQHSTETKFSGFQTVYGTKFSGFPVYPLLNPSFSTLLEPGFQVSSYLTQTRCLTGTLLEPGFQISQYLIGTSLLYWTRLSVVMSVF